MPEINDQVVIRDKKGGIRAIVEITVDVDPTTPDYRSPSTSSMAKMAEDIEEAVERVKKEWDTSNPAV